MNLIEVIERQDAIICELSALCADLADELSMFRGTEKEERRIRELLEGFPDTISDGAGSGQYLGNLPPEDA